MTKQEIVHSKDNYKESEKEVSELKKSIARIEKEYNVSLLVLVKDNLNFSGNLREGRVNAQRITETRAC